LLGVGLNCAQLDTDRVKKLNDGDWEALFSLANYHEVAALLFDAIVKDSTTTVPIDVRLKFLGMQEIAEQSYQHHLNTLAELLDFFDNHNIPTMVIKGLSLAQYYPIPAHRKCGDIDIYQFGKQQQADKLFSQLFGIEIKNNIVGHHTNYQYKGISIENHYHFVTTYYGGKSLELEDLLENEANDSVLSEIKQQNVFFPSPTLNAIFLPYHMAVHFREERVSMRQIIDWMMFLKTEYDNVDWTKVYEIYRKYNLGIFVNAINGILINYFNMPEKYAYHYTRNKKLEMQILNDMIEKKGNGRDSGLWDGIMHEWKQYIGSGWKFRLFGKIGFFELVKKVWNFLNHREDFKERIVFVPNIKD
jgi:hypothetical protein